MSKLTRAEAQKQARRLQSAPMLAPQSDDGRKEIVDCLLRHCADAAHDQRAMTRVLDGTLDPRNLTAEIAAAAAESRSVPVVELPPGCARCTLDPDLITGAARYASHISEPGELYDVSRRCDCARGRSLASRDAEHGAAVSERARAASDIQSSPDPVEQRREAGSER